MASEISKLGVFCPTRTVSPSVSSTSASCSMSSLHFDFAGSGISSDTVTLVSVIIFKKYEKGKGEKFCLPIYAFKFILGIWTAAAGIRNFDLIWFTIRQGFAPGLRNGQIEQRTLAGLDSTYLTILLMKDNRGTL